MPFQQVVFEVQSLQIFDDDKGFQFCLIKPLAILYFKGLSVWGGVQRAPTLRIRLFSLFFQRKPGDRIPQGGSQSVNEDKEAVSEEC